MLKRTCLNRAAMAGALVDWGHSSNAVVRAQCSHVSANYYQNSSCLRTVGGRESTFLLGKSGQAANQALRRAVA